jgi:DNA-binding transcriptional MerR regulator
MSAKPDTIYMTSDISSVTGLGRHTVYYYLTLGLIAETGRTWRGNYRYFDQSVIERLQKIIALRAEGLSLDAIKERLEELGHELL